MSTVRYFAAAAEATGTNTETIAAATLGDLRRQMIDAHGSELERVLDRCALLVNGSRSEEASTALAESDQVDVLPPFAGG